MTRLQDLAADLRAKMAVTQASFNVLETEINLQVPPPPPPPPLPITPLPLLNSPIAGKSWVLSFRDEFDAGKLDLAKWNQSPFWITTNGGSINNSGLFQVDGSQYEFTGTMLRIRSDRQADGKWKTAAISAHDKFSQLGGFFEACIRLPKGSGQWPGWWTMPADRNWDIEIDICESNGFWPRLHAPNLHAKDAAGNWQVFPKYDQTGPDYSQAFHVFGVHWVPGVQLDYYRDGAIVHTIKNSLVPKRPMYPLFSLEVSNGGTSWPSPNAASPSPAYLDIDWCRCWK